MSDSAGRARRRRRPQSGCGLRRSARDRRARVDAAVPLRYWSRTGGRTKGRNATTKTRPPPLKLRRVRRSLVHLRAKRYGETAGKLEEISYISVFSELFPAVKEYGDGAVVDQRHRHRRLEPAGCHRHPIGLQIVNHGLVQRPSLVRRRGPVARWPPPYP